MEKVAANIFSKQSEQAYNAWIKNLAKCYDVQVDIVHFFMSMIHVPHVCSIGGLWYISLHLDVAKTGSHIMNLISLTRRMNGIVFSVPYNQTTLNCGKFLCD